MNEFHIPVNIVITKQLQNEFSNIRNQGSTEINNPCEYCDYKATTSRTLLHINEQQLPVFPLAKEVLCTKKLYILLAILTH